jgi:hypothetical protein
MNQVSIQVPPDNHEEVPESPRNLIIERLQTEMTDQDQELQIREVKQELAIWCICSFAVLIVLVLLEIRTFSSFGLFIAFIPLVLLEVLSLTLRLLRIISNTSLKKNLSDSFISLGNLIFWSLLIIDLKSNSINLVLLTVPLALPAFVAMFVRSSRQSSCSAFSSHVRSTQLYVVFRWVKIIAVLFIGLKMENYTDWTWFGILWPVWICLGFLYVASAFIIGITVGSLCSWLYKDTQLSDVLCNLWLLYTTSGGALSVTVALMRLLKGFNSFVFFWPGIYLLLFLSCTGFFINSLAAWWTHLFTDQDIYSIPSNSASNLNSLPISRSTSIRNVSKNFKLPPKVLHRLTSTYFQPFEEKKLQKTLSDDLGVQKEFHIRNLSMPSQESKSINSSIDDSFEVRKCQICLENQSDAVLMDCGHGGICTFCADFLFESNNQCHMCRAEIVQVLKVKIKNSKLAEVVGVK